MTEKPADQEIMPQEIEKKVLNRWIVVVGAMMIQLALGAIYAWSAFTTPLQGIPANIDAGVTGVVSQYAFSKTETQAIFSAGLAFFAIFTIVGGRLQQRYGPRIIGIIGGIVLGTGYILGGMVGDSFPAKLITLGVIGGTGIGLAYVVPIAVGVKWFPDKKGLVTGLAVAGFGFGAFIWILLANPPSVLPLTGLIQAENATFTISNVDGVFRLYGILFMALVVLGSLVMVNPPEGWKPKGWDPESHAKKGGIVEGNQLIPGEMLRTRQFYLLWMMFMVGALAGLMVIGNVQNFAKDAVDGFAAKGFTPDQASDYAVIGAAVCLPILNGTGRIAWGQISDKLGRKKSIILMNILQGSMMGIFFFTTTSPIFFFVVAAMIGFNFGGNFALFPAATADSFGSKYVGLNYGFVFTSYGVGGIVGPILAGAVQDANMSFFYAFVPAAAMCLFACLLAAMYNPEVVPSVKKGESSEKPAKAVDPETGELKEAEPTYYPPPKRNVGDADAPRDPEREVNAPEE